MSGDQVLALLPIAGSPFQAKHSGPYTVVRQCSDENYKLATPDRRKKHQLCHINLLKAYYMCQLGSSPNKDVGEVRPVLLVGSGPGFSGSPAVDWGDEEGVSRVDDAVLRGRLRNSEFLATLPDVLHHLSPDRCAALVGAYPSLFADTPSRTHWAMHDIEVGDAEPIRQRFYLAYVE